MKTKSEVRREEERRNGEEIATFYWPSYCHVSTRRKYQNLLIENDDLGSYIQNGIPMIL